MSRDLYIKKFISEYFDVHLLVEKETLKINSSV